MDRYPRRDDLREMAGYHSPQVTVKVRLNTNESPIEPPAEFVRALAAAVSDVKWNRYPDRSARELRAAIHRANRRGERGQRKTQGRLLA
ncbi:MAG: histidinol-phosphate transaminase [Actinomycetota bacterium]